MENCTPVVKVGWVPEAPAPEAMPPALVMTSSASTTCPPSLVICGGMEERVGGWVGGWRVGAA